MTDGERTIGTALSELIPKLSETGLRLLLAYGSGLADGKANAARDQPDGNGRR